MNVGTLTIEMAAGVARLSKDMADARRTVDRAIGDIGTSIDRLKGMVAGAFAGLTVGAFAAKLVSVQREFDVLNSSLITVTGSATAAEREMAWIKTFAAETPYGLAEVTKGFVKMKALGLDASMAALRSYGNTASAMGKGLNDMIEAVADAATGEFERLKEFGIRASKEGDNVTFTFQGVETKIRNTADNVTEYLRKIGDNNFGEAMANRAATLDGALSNLGDTWDELFRVVNQQSTGSYIYETVKMATGAVEDLIKILQAMGTKTDEVAEKSRGFDTAQKALATIFETVAVLGANVAFVFDRMGKAIGLVMSAYDAAFSLDSSKMDLVREMGREYAAESERLRAEVDATSTRILNARTAVKEETKAVEENIVKKRVAAGVSKEAAKEAKKFAEQLQDLIQSIDGESSGVSKDFYEKVELLRKAYDKGAISLERFQQLAERYIKTQKFYVEAERESAKAVEDRNREVQRLYEAQEKNLDSIDEMVRNLEFEAEAIKLTNTEREIAIRLRELETKGLEQGSAAWIEYEQRIRSAINGKAAVEAAKEARKKTEEEWAKTWDDVAKSFTDKLMDGGHSARDYLLGLFRSMVLTPTVRFLMTPFQNTLQGIFGGTDIGGMGGGGGIGGLANLVSLGRNILGALNGGFATLANNIATYAQQGINFITGAGPMGASSLPGSAAQGIGAAGSAVAGIYGGIMGGRLISGGYSAIGSSGNSAVNTGTAIGAAVGSIFPVIGTALGALIGGLLGGTVNRLFGRKLVDTGIEGEFGGEEGFVGRTYQFYKGGTFRSDKTKYGELDEKTRKAFADQYEALKTNIQELGGVLGLAPEALDNFTARMKVSLQGLSPEEAQKRLEEEFTKLGISMADMILGLPGTIQEEVNGRRYLFGVNPDALEAVPVDPVAQANAEAFRKLQKDGESSLDTLVRLARSLQTVNAVFQNLGNSILDASMASGDFASRLIDAFGGQDAFLSTTTAYFEAFYSEGEKYAALQRQLGDAFSKMNVTMPTTNAELRALIESQDLSTEEGMKMYVALMKLAGVFNTMTTEAERLAEAERQRKEEAASASRDLELRILRAQGKEVEALALERAKELELLKKQHPELVGRLEELYRIEDAERARALLEKEREDAERARQELEEKRYDIELRILRAQGKEVEALAIEREKELAAIRSSHPELEDRVRQLYRIEDAERARASAEAASKAAVDKAYSNLQNAITMQNEALDAAAKRINADRAQVDKSRSTQQAVVANLKSVFDALGSASEDLLKTVRQTANTMAAQGWEYIDAALDQARKTGALPDLGDLQSAIASARTGLVLDRYTSRTELEYDTMVLANKLTSLQEVTGKQKTTAEQMLYRLEQQIERYDLELAAIAEQKDANQKMLEYWRRQIDINSGVFNHTANTVTAIQDLTALVRQYTVGNGGTTVPGGGTTQPGGGAVWGGSSSGGASYDNSPSMIGIDDDGRVLYSDGSVGPAREVWQDAFGNWVWAKNHPDSSRNKSDSRAPAFDVVTQTAPADPLMRIDGNASSRAALEARTEQSEANVNQMTGDMRALRVQMDKTNEILQTISAATNGRPDAPVPFRAVSTNGAN